MPPDSDWLANCLQMLKDRDYARVGNLKGLLQFTIDRQADTSIIIRWFEKGKAESLTPRKTAIANRKVRRAIVEEALKGNDSALTTYDQVEAMFIAQGVEPIARQLLYKQISDIIGRNSKRSVTLEK
jgi:hypothetical protein